VPEAKVLQLEDVAGQLKPLGQSQEIRYATCVEAGHFTQGIIAFAGKPASGSQITHDDKDVLCYVISGTGRLRSGDREMVLKQGSICHVPASVPHDFQATGDRELVLLYTLVEAGSASPPAQRPE
jgi:mannose-6-phosphate isomerase-like protein (cupin superfamily)